MAPMLFSLHPLNHSKFEIKIMYGITKAFDSFTYDYNGSGAHNPQKYNVIINNEYTLTILLHLPNRITMRS